MGSNQKQRNGKVVEEKLIVAYKSELYDLTEFIYKHPGGVNTLFNKNQKDIEKSFRDAEHSKAAEYLLHEYKLKPENKFDERLEHLVNWKSGMISQISSLGSKYEEWVNLPVDRHLRLFDNSLLESLSKTPWFLPPLIWIPFITYCIVNEFLVLDGSFKAKFSTIGVNIIVGIFIWTLLEYTLHRYLFHIDVKKYPKMSTFHFLIHGLHHKVPFDEYRLVFPPFPAAILASILYQPILLLYCCGIIAYPRLLLAGGLIGYLCYDMIHFYIHYGNPTNSYMYNLKRYHHNHHFVNHNQGFGISNSFWDNIFGTEISLKKLKFILKWRF